MDRNFLLASTLCFLMGFASSMFSLGAGFTRASRWNVLVLSAGFVLQTIFLGLRGAALGRCPLTNLFEVLVFLSWATVLFYLAIGPSYRVSPLGVFTAPLALVLQVVGLALPVEPPWATAAGRPVAPVQPWLEFHAAFSVLAYGAFALAGITGGLYLWQEHQLKTRRLTSTFFQLPPIGDLGRVNDRLLSVGFGLLTLGLAAGWIALGTPTSHLHFAWALATWLLYGVLVWARHGRKLAPRRVATFSLLSFGFALVILSGLSFAGGSSRGPTGSGPALASPDLASPTADPPHPTP